MKYQQTNCLNCNHDKWDHELEESYDSYFFLGCEIENCKCKGFELKKDTMDAYP